MTDFKNISKTTPKIWAIVPAAGIGSRVGSSIPKQYIRVNGLSIIEHTLKKLAGCKEISKVIVALSKTDEYFINLSTVHAYPIHIVEGGVERSDSVLSGLEYLKTIAADDDWVLVHDAARPCVLLEDINSLISKLKKHKVGGILGLPVRDTMKRVSNSNMQCKIQSTVERENLWHALTPQMFRIGTLYSALVECKKNNLVITDEASAIEQVGLKPEMVEGRACNIKITQADDLQLAAFYLGQQETN